MTNEQLNKRIKSILDGVYNCYSSYQGNEPKISIAEAKQQLNQLIKIVCEEVIGEKDESEFEVFELENKYRNKLRTEQLSKLNELMKG